VASGRVWVRRLPVKTPGEFGALALGQAAECLAGRDPTAVQDICGLHAAELGEREQYVEHLCRLKVRGRLEQQRVDRHAAGFEVALELRAKRPDLVGPTERVDALIRAALRCCPVRVERVVGGGRDSGEATRAVRASPICCLLRMPDRRSTAGKRKLALLHVLGTGRCSSIRRADRWPRGPTAGRAGGRSGRARRRGSSGTGGCVGARPSGTRV
jgi:hypothetical protein